MPPALQSGISGGDGIRGNRESAARRESGGAGIPGGINVKLYTDARRPDSYTMQAVYH